MSGEVQSVALQFLIGAIVTQVLLIVISVQSGSMDVMGVVQEFPGKWGEMAASMNVTNFMLFGIFDLAGGIGFTALLHGKFDGFLPFWE